MARSLLLCAALVLHRSKHDDKTTLVVPTYRRSRTVRTILAVLRRSTQRMPPTRRAKFLEAALQPALKATKRVAEGDPGSPRQRQDPGSSSDDGEDDDEGGGDGGGHEQGASPPPPPPPPPPEAAAHEVASRAAYEAAASAAETAMEFVGPLVEQACAERENLARGPTEEPKTDRGGDRRSVGGAHSAGAKNGAVGGPVGCSWEDVSASDLSMAAYLGFALSALELAAERSACMAATAATAAASPASPAAPSAPPPVEEKSEVMEALTKAEERLVGLVIGGPVTTSVDLQFVLLHGCRLSYADRDKRRRVDEGGDDDGDEEERVPGPARGRRRARLSRGRGGGLVGLAEAAVGGALPWALGGVSTVAYLVSEAMKQGGGSSRPLCSLGRVHTPGGGGFAWGLLSSRLGCPVVCCPSEQIPDGETTRLRDDRCSVGFVLPPPGPFPRTSIQGKDAWYATSGELLKCRGPVALPRSLRLHGNC